MGSAQFIRDEYLYRPAALHVVTVSNPEIQAFMRADGSLGYSASVPWPTNNLAIYTPLPMDSYFTVARFLVANGNNTTGTVDVGLFDASMNKLHSTGNSARSGTITIQYFDVSNRTFPPGNYFLGLVASSTLGTYGGAGAFSASRFGRAVGMMQETLGSATLPSTITPAAYAQTQMFIYGFTQSDTL